MKYFNLGEFAIRSLIKIARQLVTICELSYRRDLLECCCNIENLLLKYKDLLRRRLVIFNFYFIQIDFYSIFIFKSITGPECVMISRSLSSHIYQLQYRLQEAIIYQVSDDFMDITSTIKTLREAALLSSSIYKKKNLENINKNCFR